MPVFADLASGGICFPPDSSIWSAQPSEHFQTLWSIKITEDNMIESNVSDLGSKDFPPDSLATCLNLCIPGSEFQKNEPVRLVDAPSRAIKIPPRSSQRADLFSTEPSIRAPTVSFVAHDLVTSPPTSPTASFVPAPCGDQIVFNKGHGIREIHFSTESTDVARFLNGQAWRERILARVIEESRGTDMEPIMAARLEIAEHQDRHPCTADDQVELPKLITRFADTSLPERFRHLVVPGETLTLGDLVGRVCTAVFLVYYCGTSEVSPEQRMALRDVMVDLRRAKRIYMPNNEGRVMRLL